jgi:trimeric autotransporter adhesin
VSATVPYSVADAKQTSLTISSNGVASAPVTLAVAPSSPAIFTADASGKGQAAAENQDYSINGPSHPAVIGSVVALYGTGGGPLTSDALPRLMLPVSATVGGLPAQVDYAGIAPGLVQGAMQINVAIPSAVTPGPSVPVVVTVGNAVSNTVTIAVQ